MSVLQAMELRKGHIVRDEVCDVVVKNVVKKSTSIHITGVRVDNGKEMELRLPSNMWMFTVKKPRATKAQLALGKPARRP